MCEEFGISNKVFKIVTDSAANNKCAFRTEVEAQDETNILVNMLAKQRKKELLKEKENLIKEMEAKALVEINSEIEEFNSVVPSLEIKRPKTAAELQLEMDNDEDDETEEIVDSDSADKVSKYKKVVSKSKFSHLIAEELSNLKVKFNKKNTKDGTLFFL